MTIITHCLAFAWNFYNTLSKADAERELARHQCSVIVPSLAQRLEVSFSGLQFSTLLTIMECTDVINVSASMEHELQEQQ